MVGDYYKDVANKPDPEKWGGSSPTLTIDDKGTRLRHLLRLGHRAARRLAEQRHPAGQVHGQGQDLPGQRGRPAEWLLPGRRHHGLVVRGWARGHAAHRLRGQGGPTRPDTSSCSATATSSPAGPPTVARRGRSPSSSTTTSPSTRRTPVTPRTTRASASPRTGGSTPSGGTSATTRASSRTTSTTPTRRTTAPPGPRTSGPTTGRSTAASACGATATTCGCPSAWLSTDKVAVFAWDDTRNADKLTAGPGRLLVHRPARGAGHGELRRPALRRGRPGRAGRGGHRPAGGQHDRPASAGPQTATATEPVGHQGQGQQVTPRGSAPEHRSPEPRSPVRPLVRADRSLSRLAFGR